MRAAPKALVGLGLPASLRSIAAPSKGVGVPANALILRNGTPLILRDGSPYLLRAA